MLAGLKDLVGRRRGPADATSALGRYAAAGGLAGLSVVAGAVAGGPSFVSHLPGAWFFGTPGGPLGFISASSGRPPAVSILAVYGGLAALAAVWWRFLQALRHGPTVSVRDVARVIGVWSAPFLVAPPLFSRDVYSYAGQGLLATFHIDPYVYGPGVLGATRFNLLAGHLWANTPSPYGPTFLSLDGVVTRLSGHQVLVDLVLLRLLELAGLVLLGVGLAVLARTFGKDPATAVVLGAGSPLVLTTLLGGAHNDALMIGLLVAGLAAWRRWGPVPGIVLCALAGGVKAPALLGIIVIGWNWAPPGTRARWRVPRTLGALGIGAATLSAVSAVSGIGWGWITTLTAADKISTGVTPVDALAHGLTGVLHLAGAEVAPEQVRQICAVGGLVAAAAVGTWLLWRSPRTEPVRALGLTLLVIALLSPVLWAWYVTWGVAVLAAVAEGRFRRAVVWLIVAETVIGASSVSKIFDALGREGPMADVMVVAGVAAATLAALTGRYEARRRELRRVPGAHAGGVVLDAVHSPPG